MPLSRRSFLTLASTCGLTALWPPGWRRSPAQAQAQPQTLSVVKIAHLSSRVGPGAEMASYAVMGAQLGAEEAEVTAGMFGTKVELVIEDAVTAENVVSTASRLRGQANLLAIIGALDDLGTATLSDLAQQQRLVFVNAAARGGDLRGEKCHRHTFHVEPELAMYAHAIGLWLLQNNRKRWYFVVSGDSFGEEIYRRASGLLQRQGGMDLGRSTSAPGERDYQAVLAQLAHMEAEAIVVALMGEELRHFLAQSKAAGLATLIAGAPLDMVAMWHVDPAYLQGVWATSWYHGLERYSGRELNRRFVQRFGKPAEAHAWANWAAVKLLVEGALRRTSPDTVALINYLEGSPPFDGHKGKALTFRAWNHQLRQPLFIVKARESKPEHAWNLFEVIAEMPPPTARGKPVAELLDTLGESKADSNCRLEAL
jgi:ABC-type branched-subunit amino acid transport system substrate-binding protein